MTIFIHSNERTVEQPFNPEDEQGLLATINELPSREYWTIHQLFDGETIGGHEKLERLMSELKSAIHLGLQGEDLLQLLVSNLDNNQSVRLEVT